MKTAFTFILLYISTFVTAQNNSSKVYKENWSKFVTTSYNYSFSELGGIDNPKVVVKNDLPYNINKIYIIGYYINPKNEILRREISAPFTISAKSQVTINFPTWNRGVKFRTKIVEINCTNLKLNETCQSCKDQLFYFD